MQQNNRVKYFNAREVRVHWNVESMTNIAKNRDMIGCWKLWIEALNLRVEIEMGGGRYFSN